MVSRRRFACTEICTLYTSVLQVLDFEVNLSPKSADCKIVETDHFSIINLCYCVVIIGEELLSMTEERLQ